MIESVNGHVWAIILAAGFSTRMGKPKLLLPYKGKSLLRHAIEECLKSHLEGIIVVVNPLIKNLVNEARIEGVSKIILNDQSEKGMSTSVKIGLRSLPETVQSVIFLLGDQPLMSSAEINTIIKDHNRNQGFSIIQAKYQGIKGHPVLFKKNLFPHLMKINGDEGGKSVIKKFEHQVYYSEMNRKAIPDVDTPRDYQLLMEGETD
ncbi:NTP transferase domain-containing protein [Neobacillus sp. NPDC097160]|uniref:nucleotidyltransferase family protein n=1 Tax=Neobacillus sp. NPDC097160 TaxID=3364298 RepID=UPI0037F346FD